MNYEDAVQYILKECNGLDLSLINIENIIDGMKPKEEAAG